MSDDNHEPIYTVQLPDSDFLTTQASHALYRRVKSDFIKLLDAIPGGVSTTRCTCGNYMLKTKMAEVEVLADDRQVFYAFYNNQDMPRSSWRTGQLVFHLIESIQNYFHPESVELLVHRNRPVRDLIVAKVQASIGDKSIEDTIGVIPLHYFNGRETKESKSLIRDFQEDVLNDFALTEGKDGVNEIKFTTKIAYAWHNRHGTLTGFNKGKCPTGLDVKVLQSGTVMLPR